MPDQAIDVRADSGGVGHQPFPSLKEVQTWESFPGNTNQIITVYY